MKSVGCRITNVKTKLFCEIEIFMSGQIWSKINNPMARLNIVESGGWGFLSDDEKYIGITILPPTPNKTNPDGSRSYSAIADLNGVPDGFVEKAKCGKYLSGGGIWHSTKENITYELYFPCV